MTVAIVVIKRRDDFHASVAGHPEMWGSGKTAFAAIGDMVVTYGEIFNISKVEHQYPHPKLNWICNLRNYQGTCEYRKNGECIADEDWRNGCRYVSCSVE